MRHYATCFLCITSGSEPIKKKLKQKSLHSCCQNTYWILRTNFHHKLAYIGIAESRRLEIFQLIYMNVCQGKGFFSNVPLNNSVGIYKQQDIKGGNWNSSQVRLVDKIMGWPTWALVKDLPPLSWPSTQSPPPSLSQMPLSSRWSPTPLFSPSIIMTESW